MVSPCSFQVEAQQRTPLSVLQTEVQGQVARCGNQAVVVRSLITACDAHCGEGAVARAGGNWTE